MARRYLALRGSQSQRLILDETLRIARENVRLTSSKFRNGVTTNLDVANAQAQVAAIEAAIPSRQAEQDELINALSLLLAQPPQALQAELAPAHPLPAPTARLPVGLRPESYIQMTTRSRLDDGSLPTRASKDGAKRPIRYGMGLFLAGEARDLELSHDGAIDGFTASLTTMTGADVTVAMLVNTSPSAHLPFKTGNRSCQARNSLNEEVSPARAGECPRPTMKR